MDNEKLKKWQLYGLTLLLIVTVIGVSFAAVSFARESGENLVSTGQIRMSYTEPDNAYVVENALPISNEEGKASTNYFEFKIMSHARTNADDNEGVTIPYSIILGKLAIDTGMNQLEDSKIMVYLTKVENGVETEVISPVLLSSLEKTATGDVIIHATEDVHKNGSSQKTTTYRLRAWINFSVDASIFTKESKYQYKFKVNVNANVNYKIDALEMPAYAVYSEDDKSLRFYRSDNPIKVGDTYNDRKVTAVYTGFEDDEYANPSSVLWHEYRTSIKTVVFEDEIQPISTANWFYCFYYCSTMDLTKLNTSKVIDMSGMFVGCEMLTSLDTSSFDTSNVTNMVYMFDNCSSLTSLDLSSFDTSNVTNMGSMFNNCNRLTSLNLSSYDTINVTNMDYMFSWCSSLTSLDVSNFDTSNVKDMWDMFRNCSSLTSLDVSNFDTSNVENMNGMFRNCSSLTSLDVSSFDTKNVTDMNEMFVDCNSLTSLDLSSFDTSNVTSTIRMFYGCNNITEAYARTEADAARLNASSVKPTTWNFVVK